jgi:hypothetical protein
MAGFQKTVLMIAIVILIISLIIIGVAMSYATDKNWPPYIPQCPDYWVMDGSGNDTKCINVKNLGVNRCTTANTPGYRNFTINTYKAFGESDDANCRKFTFARDCRVSWDGITYGVTNPCNTTA